jgi:hypothetical protein
MFDYHGEMSNLKILKELQCLNLLKTLEISMLVFFILYEFKIDFVNIK